MNNEQPSNVTSTSNDTMENEEVLTCYDLHLIFSLVQQQNNGSVRAKQAQAYASRIWLHF